MLAVGVISLALISKHWPNLQRLLTGSEPKIGAKKH
jgi:glycerol-3-phosphate acyltransferase PlsY